MTTQRNGLENWNETVLEPNNPIVGNNNYGASKTVPLNGFMPFLTNQSLRSIIETVGSIYYTTVSPRRYQSRDFLMQKASLKTHEDVRDVAYFAGTMDINQ